jgi:hypothetical protein
MDKAQRPECRPDRFILAGYGRGLNNRAKDWVEYVPPNDMPFKGATQRRLPNHTNDRDQRISPPVSTMPRRNIATGLSMGSFLQTPTRHSLLTTHHSLLTNPDLLLK